MLLLNEIMSLTEGEEKIGVFFSHSPFPRPNGTFRICFYSNKKLAIPVSDYVVHLTPKECTYSRLLDEINIAKRYFSDDEIRKRVIESLSHIK